MFGRTGCTAVEKRSCYKAPHSVFGLYDVLWGGHAEIDVCRTKYSPVVALSCGNSSVMTEITIPQVFEPEPRSLEGNFIKAWNQ